MAKHKTARKFTLPPQLNFLNSQRFWSITLAILFLFTAIFVTVHYRTATKDLEVAEQWAQNSIRTNAINQVAQGIRQQYPTLPDASVQAEAAKQWDAYYAQNKDAIDTQATQLAAQIRTQYQYEAGKTEKFQQTYVLEMDPYYWWQQAVNYADHGDTCELGSARDEQGLCIDAKRLAPVGTLAGLNLHIWLEAMAIRVMSVINPNLDSLTVVFYIPVLLAALSVIPAFFIGRRVAGNIGGFVAAIIIATHPLFMNRTAAGFADTDGYAILFPLMLVWLILEAYAAKQWWSRITLAALAGITAGLAAYGWGGWWFLFFVILASLIGYMIYMLATTWKRSHKLSKDLLRKLAPVAAVFGTFIVVAAISITIFTSFASFIGAFLAPFQFTTNLQAATAADATGYPNILTTVAELNIPGLGTIIASLGGAWLLALSAFGIFATLIDARKLSWGKAGAAIGAFIYFLVLILKGGSLQPILFLALFTIPYILAFSYIFWHDEDIDIRYSILLLGWLLATLFATTKGIRFLMLGLPPFAIGFGIAIGWLFIAATSMLKREWDRPFAVNAIVGAIILLILFNPAAAYNPLTNAKVSSSQQLPGMNDFWWDSMQYLNTQTPPNTIVTSWWDFGHWFRNVGNRSVTFDGASQNPEPGHLVGKLLLTNNEEQALGLLQMLDCGQNTAYQAIHKHYEVVPAKELTDELLLMSRAEAQARLRQTELSAEEQTYVLERMHCNPPPAIFITSGDMIGKGGVWGHFGAWDFKKAMAFNYVQSLPQTQAVEKIKELGYDDAQATEMYFKIKSFSSDGEANGWISPWPGYITQGFSSCVTRNATVSCNVGVGVSQTNQGTVVIETISFTERDALRTVNITYGLYANSQRLGGAVSTPARIVLADVTTKRMDAHVTGQTDFNAGVLIRKEGSGANAQYGVLLADPLQIDSLFTQLYFLDGAFTPHFQKVFERTEPGGSKIILWNVTWPAP